MQVLNIEYSDFPILNLPLPIHSHTSYSPEPNLVNSPHNSSILVDENQQSRLNAILLHDLQQRRHGFARIPTSKVLVIVRQVQGKKVSL